MPSRQLIFIFILVFVAGFLVWLIAKDYPQKIETERQIGDIKSKIESLKKEEGRQKSLTEYLNSESYLEKQARLRLNLKKEGEEVVFVYRKDQETQPPQQERQNENPFLSKLKEWFKKVSGTLK